MIKQLAHIGLVVKNLEQARDFYNSVFKLNTSPLIEEEEFRVSLIDVGDIKLELMSPVGNKGTLAKFLEKRGEGIHHLCFEVDDIDSALESLATQGIELVNKEPQPGAEGRMAFLHPHSTHGVLIELVEKQ
jgi:methylmalonyl-CoA epimerase